MDIGRRVKQPGGYTAFIPQAFSPREMTLSQKTVDLLAKANLSLGRLDGIAELLPDLNFFILMYVKKEAAFSSQLEGTQATLSDLIKAESDITEGVPEDVDDIRHYIKAMEYGLARLSELPLSLRLVKEVHGILLTGGRSTGFAYPGEFRTTQNWIGGRSPLTARYVPPSPHEMMRALDDLEKFLYQEDTLPLLVKAGLAHAQFETIHPFVDGNGRTGRLLTTFYLYQQGILTKPVLYLSEYLKKNRDAYFDYLQFYHDKGEIEPWLDFFLEGVAVTAEEAVTVSRQIIRLREESMSKVTALGQSSEKGFILLRHLFEHPIIAVRNVEEAAGLNRANSNKLVERFVQAGILEQSDKSVRYGRTFVYREYLDIFTGD